MYVGSSRCKPNTSSVAGSATQTATEVLHFNNVLELHRCADDVQVNDLATRNVGQCERGRRGRRERQAAACDSTLVGKTTYNTNSCLLHTNYLST